MSDKLVPLVEGVRENKLQWLHLAHHVQNNPHRLVVGKAAPAKIPAPAPLRQSKPPILTVAIANEALRLPQFRQQHLNSINHHNEQHPQNNHHPQLNHNHHNNNNSSTNHNNNNNNVLSAKKAESNGGSTISTGGNDSTTNSTILLTEETVTQQQQTVTGSTRIPKINAGKVGKLDSQYIFRQKQNGSILEARERSEEAMDQ